VHGVVSTAAATAVLRWFQTRRLRQPQISTTFTTAPHRRLAQPPVPQNDLMGSLRHEMNRLFDNFSLTAASLPYRRRMPLLDPMRDWIPGYAAVPPMDLVEDDGGYLMTVELPGLSREDIKLRVTEDMISISAEMSESHKSQKGEHRISELRYGTLQRALALPPGIDTNKIEATFKNGMLRVTLPKSEKARKNERAIEVRAS
ncbi:Hsp20/alpha crystallin family protein, partial [Jannaschia formosa]|uniref:Hsp20/alpha crystallin family protein n=1 Tax=Jannaschia formosa TaxID=2259592 RepID=UPI0010749FBA